MVSPIVMDKHMLRVRMSFMSNEALRSWYLVIFFGACIVDAIRKVIILIIRKIKDIFLLSAPLGCLIDIG